MKQLLIILAFSTVIQIFSTKSYGAEKIHPINQVSVMTPELSQCISLIRQCDQTIKFLVPIVNQQEDALKKINADYDEIVGRLQEAEKRSWYENPFVAGTIGAFVGIVTIEALRR